MRHLRKLSQIIVGTGLLALLTGGAVALAGGGSHIPGVGYVQRVVAGTGVTVTGTPAAPVINATSSSSGLTAVFAGSGITVGAGGASGVTVTNSGVRSLTAGTNVTLGGTATDPVVNASSTAGSGTILRVSVLTSGTSLAVQSGTNKALVWMCGGGGGGGGVASPAASNAAVGGGGGSAACGFWQTTTIPGVNWTYTIGAQGTAGSTTPSAGGNGGSSTFSNGTTTFTTPGGTGGSTSTASTVAQSKKGGAGGTVATNGSINAGGTPGGPGVVVSITVYWGGFGASSWFGSGGQGAEDTTTPGAGGNAIGFGAGGGAAAQTASGAAAVGGTGSPGVILLYELS